MIIDFHTHMFPDKIAASTIAYLEDICKIKACTDGTYEGLRASTEEAGIDVSIALPVVTKPSQFASINRFAAEHQASLEENKPAGSENILSFGGIHPDSEDYRAELNEIKNMGLKGIKLHPDYQEVYFNDIRYKRIISYATELGLIISVHAGVDPKCPDDVHCTPKMAREVIDEVQPEKLVLAHMGGNEMWDQVEELLVGENVYFDTGVVLDSMPQEQFLRMVRDHGTEKILFGTDCPWAEQKKYVDLIKTMPLTEKERTDILSGTARKLLNIS